MGRVGGESRWGLYVGRVGVLYCIVLKRFYSCILTMDETTWHLSQLDTITESSGI